MLAAILSWMGPRSVYALRFGGQYSQGQVPRIGSRQGWPLSAKFEVAQQELQLDIIHHYTQLLARPESLLWQ